MNGGQSRTRQGHGRGAARRTTKWRSSPRHNSDNWRSTKERPIGHLCGYPIGELPNCRQKAIEEFRKRLGPVPENEGEELGTHITEKNSDGRISQDIQLKPMAQQDQLTLQKGVSKNKARQGVQRKRYQGRGPIVTAASYSISA